MWFICYKKSCFKIYYYKSNIINNSVKIKNNNRTKNRVNNSAKNKASNKTKNEINNKTRSKINNRDNIMVNRHKKSLVLIIINIYIYKLFNLIKIYNNKNQINYYSKTQ